jgi:molybdenum cofactor cytidylyltransferase
MGSPKALLEGRTFLARLVGALEAGGCDEIVVVAGPREDANAAAIARLAASLGARVAINPDPDSHQLDSLRVAINVVPDAEAIVFTPVDAPAANSEVVATLVDSVRAGSVIAIPTFEGRRGHPVAIGRALFPDVLNESLPDGVRTLIRRYAAELAEIAVDDPHVLLDIDTPADYLRLRESGG